MNRVARISISRLYARDETRREKASPN